MIEKYKAPFIIIGIICIVVFTMIIVCQSFIYAIDGPPATPVTPLSEQGSATLASECVEPILGGGDGLETTACGTLAIGEIATGVFHTTSEAQNWQFSFQNRAYLTVTVEGEVCPNIRVLNSKGNAFRILQLGCGRDVFRFNTLTPTDTHILRLSMPQDPGVYWLKIE